MYGGFETEAQVKGKLGSGVKEATVDLALAWQQLEELLRACQHKGRWGQALSSLVATAKVEMLAAMRAARRYSAGLGVDARADVDCAILVVRGSLRHEALRLLQSGGLCVLAAAWKWATGLEEEAAAAIRGIVGVANEGRREIFVELSEAELSQPTVVFPHVAASFGAALAGGVDWQQAVVGHSRLATGWYSMDGRKFRCSTAAGGPAGGRDPGPCRNFIALGKEREPEVTLHLLGDELLGVSSTTSLRIA